MLAVVFWLAVACGCVSALTGNRTAWALLASVGLCFVFDYAGVPFSFPLWLLIDLAVILAIIHPRMSKADCIVVALFVPAWVGYLLPDQQRFQMCLWVVVTQLALTYRHDQTLGMLDRAWARVRRLLGFNLEMSVAYG
jgi:hypothetical protein